MTGRQVTAEWRSGHVGRVLHPTDPEAWVGTLAFPGPRRPATAEAVWLHCLKHGLTDPVACSSLPVRWCFGTVYWEKKGQLQVVPDGTPCTHPSCRGGM